MIALYALCIMLPTAAVAAAHFPVSEHCLGEHQHSASGAAAHDHAGAPHQDPAGHDHGQSEKCCGLFGVTALAPEFQAIAIEGTPGSDLVVPRAASLLGSRVDRIDRPPRDLLSL